MTYYSKSFRTCVFQIPTQIEAKIYDNGEVKLFLQSESHEDMDQIIFFTSYDIQELCNLVNKPFYQNSTKYIQLSENSEIFLITNDSLTINARKYSTEFLLFKRMLNRCNKISKVNNRKRNIIKKRILRKIKNFFSFKRPMSVANHLE